MRSERGKARERERENGAPHCANCFCHFAGPNPIHSHTHALKTPRAMGLSLSDLWSRFPHTTKAPDSTARRLVHVISMCWLSLSLYFYVENESQNEFATFSLLWGIGTGGLDRGSWGPTGVLPMISPLRSAAEKESLEKLPIHTESADYHAFLIPHSGRDLQNLFWARDPHPTSLRWWPKTEAKNLNEDGEIAKINLLISIKFLVILFNTK